jgi:hypothetical protein
MSFEFLKIENRLLETDLQTSAHSFFRNQFTTTKNICGIGWKPIFLISSRKRYDLYDTKNERFIVSVIADRHKKWIFENKKNSQAQT